MFAGLLSGLATLQVDRMSSYFLFLAICKAHIFSCAWSTADIPFVSGVQCAFLLSLFA